MSVLTTAPRTRAARTIAVSALALSSLMAAAPADAAVDDFRDARGDIRYGADLQRVRVVNEKMIRVRILHRDLRPRATAGAAIYFDTDRSRRGPEFAFVGGISDGTDYAMVRTRRWSTNGRRVNCSYNLRLNYAEDISQFRMSRRCLARPEAIRVAVRVGAARGDGTEATDWLRSRRAFTRSVARG